MPSRTAGLAAALIVAFLVASLTPCPVGVESGAARRHRADASATAVSLVAACPCGCERVPVAGGSARLGASLPSVSPQIFSPGDVAPAPSPEPRLAPAFATSIDHVPLPA